ncbi:MAG: hypothetical protein ACOY3M_02525 [Patescibacteria group bacterium]
MVETSGGAFSRRERMSPMRTPERTAETNPIKSPERKNPGKPEIDKHSLEAVKAKKAQKPAPPLWRERAEFMPATAEFFRRCGIDPQYVNPTPLGEGLTNVVFSYIAPDGSPKVIKMARQMRKGFMSTGYDQDTENIALVKKYFGEYAVPTEIHKDPESERYLIVQDAIEGKAITNKIETQGVRSQLADMARLNREMMRQTGHSLDFIGVPGFLTWLRHQYRGILTKKSEFEISNILVDNEGKLKIIDEGLLRFKGVPLKQSSIANIGFMTNRLIMRLYFGVDLLPQPNS